MSLSLYRLILLSFSSCVFTLRSSFEALATLVRLLPLPLLEDHSQAIFLPMTLRLVRTHLDTVITVTHIFYEILFIISRSIAVISKPSSLSSPSFLLPSFPSPLALLFLFCLPHFISLAYPTTPVTPTNLPPSPPLFLHFTPSQVNDASPVCREAASDVIAALARRSHTILMLILSPALMCPGWP